MDQKLLLHRTTPTARASRNEGKKEVEQTDKTWFLEKRLEDGGRNRKEAISGCLERGKQVQVPQSTPGGDR